MNEKLVVYTAVTGGKNFVTDPLHPDVDVDYICYTDNPEISSSVWDVRPIPAEIKTRFSDQNGAPDNTRIAKIYKLQPHNFPELHSDMSLWVDGSIVLKMEKISAFMKASLTGKKFVVFKNPDRASVQEEVSYCIRSQKDRESVLRRQYRSYRRRGFPDKYGLINGSVILRKTLDPEVIEFNNEWWEQVMKFSKRDEVSFPYLAWINQFAYGVFEWESRYHCPLIEVREHNRK